MKPPKGMKIVLNRKTGEHYAVIAWWRVLLMRFQLWLEKRRKYTKIESRDGRYYFIEELAFANARERSSGGMGWLSVDSPDWLPFAFWKVKQGDTKLATLEEVQRYREAIEAVQRGY